MAFSSKTKSRWRVYSKVSGQKRLIFIKEFKTERSAENYTRPTTRVSPRRIIE